MLLLDQDQTLTFITIGIIENKVTRSRKLFKVTRRLLHVYAVVTRNH